MEDRKPTRRGKMTVYVTPRDPEAQIRPLPGQIRNNTGGYSHGLDEWARLDRFLLLGSEGGTYYVGERALTRDNATAALRDLLRLSHPLTDRDETRILFDWIAHPEHPAAVATARASFPLIDGLCRLRAETDPARAAVIVRGR